MAERIHWFDVTVPAGTPKTAPLETAMRFNPAAVERVELTIPDGHAGFTGIAFLLAHQQIIPFNSGLFIIGNGRELSWPLEGYPNSGSWSALCYNTDIYAHTFHVAFLVHEVNLLSTAPPAFMGAGAITGSAVAPLAAQPALGTDPYTQGG